MSTTLSTLPQPVRCHSRFIDAVTLKQGNLASIVIPGVLTPPQISTAYKMPVTDGTGIKIGILSFGGGFLQSDLDKSFSDLQVAGLIPPGLTAPTINQVLLDGQTGVFSNNLSTFEGSASFENTLDIYCIATLIPNATITIYIGNSWQSPINQMIQDGCNIISISWNTLESYHTTLDSLWDACDTANITVCVASGDTGSATNINNTPTFGVYYPTSHPKVISIGGTALTLNPDNTRFNEIDDNRDPNISTPWGGGGGISSIFATPAYQSGVSYTSIINGTLASGAVNYTGGTIQQPVLLTTRGLPDISAPMNTYAMYFDGNITGAAGTSAAAPVTAAMLARFQQQTGIQRSSVIWKNIFYLNQHRGLFYDITVGSNNVAIPNGYVGTGGWDAVTGLGALNGDVLLTIITPSNTLITGNTNSTYYTPALLGSGQPAAGQTIIVYTARTGQTVWCSMFIANVDSGIQDSVSVAIKPSGELLGDPNYILKNTPIVPNGIITLPQFGLGPNDQIFVYSLNGVSTFNVSGDQLINVLL